MAAKGKGKDDLQLCPLQSRRRATRGWKERGLELRTSIWAQYSLTLGPGLGLGLGLGEGLGEPTAVKCQGREMQAIKGKDHIQLCPCSCFPDGPNPQGRDPTAAFLTLRARQRREAWRR